MTKSKQKSRKKVNESESLKELSFRDNKTRLLLIDELLKKCTFYTNNTTNKLLEEHKDINSIIENLIIIEKDITICLPKREDNWDSFRKWCFDNNIDMSKVVIDRIDDKQGFGLKAVSDLNESELILTIPRNVMITCETAINDTNIASFIREDPLLQHMPNIVLALHVINEYCKSNSFWKSYLSTLPSSYGTPLYLNHEEITQLQGSQVFEEIIKLKRSIARQYAYFSNQLQTNQFASNLLLKKYFTYELYRWAVSTVMTRQNVIPSSDGKSMISALIPLWDICNHRFGKFSTDFNLESDSVFCHAMDNFKSGEQIYIYYGSRSNGEFFVHNGFVYNEHNQDFLPLKLGISRNDSLYQFKHELCKKLDLNISGVYHLYHKSQPIDKQLLAFLRVFHFNKAELEFWLKNDNFMDILKPDCEQLINLNEIIFKFLANRAVILMNGYLKYESKNESFKYENQNIEQLINSEKNLLKSYIL